MTSNDPLSEEDEDDFVRRVCGADPGVEEAVLRRAYGFGRGAHEGQKRSSGEPYFSHPRAVALLLAEKRLGVEAIVTGLLHDTVEDTGISLSAIAAAFGEDTAALVDGVTKLNKLEHQPNVHRQAENFRKLVVAMSRDLRVLLVKLADRVHNMRTLHFLPKEEKRRRIARETMDIYTPLAERIGVRDWKEELEDLSFQTLEPDAHCSIFRHLDALTQQGADPIGASARALETLLHDNGLQAEVNGRTKTPWSIWRKISGHVETALENVHDIIAFRVIVDDPAQCYHALGLIHSAWHSVPDRFKDYISTPKPNGYQSLHTCVIGPGERITEIQIRTRAMHEVAELGVAAHWRYKQGILALEKGQGRSYRWMRDMLDILSNAGSSREFLEHTKIDMFPDQVFVFSPKGELYTLPRGATPVDFAYAVHTDVGHHCQSARINGRIAPLRTVLNNGDQVDIVTARAQTPHPGWETFVRTGKAKSGIRRFLRSRRREQYTRLGRELLDRAFRQAGQEPAEKALKGVVSRFQCDTVEDLHVGIGEGRLPAREVVAALQEQTAASAPAPRRLEDWTPPLAAPAPPAAALQGLLRDMAVNYARCCHPLPGDRIVGIISTGRGVTIHAIDCKSLDTFSTTPERWLDLSWDADETQNTRFIGRLSASLINAPGSLASLSSAISRDGGNIANIKFTHRNQDFVDLLVDVEVTHTRQLNDIVAVLRRMPEVHTAQRWRT